MASSMLIALLLSFALSVLGADEIADQIYVAFWNVENLFDTDDDPEVALDEEFSPSGAKQWTEERLERKLRNLARVIARMNREKGPDILALAEVENRKVVERLVAVLHELPRTYRIVHKDSAGSRGIDCAIVYDSKRLELIGERFHRVERTEQPTRDIVEAHFSVSRGEQLLVFVNHWPSRAHDEQDRIRVARVLRDRMDQLLSDDPQADVLVMGDFNDFPDQPAMRETLRSVEFREEATDGRLLNTMWPIFHSGNRGTYVYLDKWETIDQILVSPGLLDGRGLQWQSGSSDTFIGAPDQLFDPPGPGIPRPNRTYSGDVYHGSGYSDHLPIKAQLKRR